MTKPVVLFVCTHNAGRSVAGRVLMDHYGQGRIEVRSAGSAPAEAVNPAILAILEERGLDASHEFPKTLTYADGEAADVIVTMGCGDTCPFIPGRRYEDWPLPDPAGQPLEAVRLVRDEIEVRVRRLLSDLGL